MTTGYRKRKSARSEGKVCDAVVRCIEQRTGETRTAIRRPEKEGVDPPVDLRLKLGTREYAIEHTQIEAFTGQIRGDAGYVQLIEPVIDEVSGMLPGPAHYELILPIETHVGVKTAELDRIRRDLITWVRAKAQCLYERNLDGLSRNHKTPRFLDYIEGRPPGFHYAARLCVNPSRSRSNPGTLRSTRWALDDQEL